jgi:hypothetical protein
MLRSAITGHIMSLLGNTRQSGWIRFGREGAVVAAFLGASGTSPDSSALNIGIRQADRIPEDP